MTPEDKAAFEAIKDKGFRNIYLNNLEKAIAEHFWHAALEYARQQPPKPVRLSRYDAAALELECTDRETGLLDAEKFAHAIMDAMQARDAGPLVEALRGMVGIQDEPFNLQGLYGKAMTDAIDARCKFVEARVEVARAALAKWEGK